MAEDLDGAGAGLRDNDAQVVHPVVLQPGPHPGQGGDGHAGDADELGEGRYLEFDDYSGRPSTVPHSHRPADGGVDRVMDGEHLGEAGDLQHLEDAALRADQRQVPVVAPHPLEPSDEHAQPGGVEELDAFQVHHDLALTLVDQLDQLLAELGRRVDVDLTLTDSTAQPLRSVTSRPRSTCVPFALFAFPASLVLSPKR